MASLAIGDDKRRELPEARPAGGVAYLHLHYGRGGYAESLGGHWFRRRRYG
jgi:hypothetical protein